METTGQTISAGNDNMSFSPQYLRGGKILTGTNFPKFVQTWNWMVNFIRNLRGDGENLSTTGYISVDRSSVDHPVIRMAQLPEQSTTNTWEFGRFKIDSISESEDGKKVIVTTTNCAIVATGKVYDAGSTSLKIEIDKTQDEILIWVKLNLSEPNMTLQTASDFSDWSTNYVVDKDNYQWVGFPLYSIKNGSVKADWRLGPFAGVYI